MNVKDLQAVGRSKNCKCGKAVELIYSEGAKYIYVCETCFKEEIKKLRKNNHSPQSVKDTQMAINVLSTELKPSKTNEKINEDNPLKTTRNKNNENEIN